MIPMKDTIYIVRPQGFDRWGEPIDPIEIEVKGRVDLNIESKTTTSGGLTSGEETVYSASILFKGLQVVRYDDMLRWIDEFGVEQVEKPINIVPLKDVGGKVVLTKVMV